MGLMLTTVSAEAMAEMVHVLNLIADTGTCFAKKQFDADGHQVCVALARTVLKQHNLFYATDVQHIAAPLQPHQN